MNNVGLFIWTKRWYNVLKELYNNNYNISWVLVLIQDSSENNIYHNEIISFCEEKSINFETSKEVKPSWYKEYIINNGIDVLFCVSWRFLIYEDCFLVPKRWIFVLHDSLLPKYRWFSPTNWVLINWEKETWLTLQRISKECDAWYILDQIKIDINDSDDANIINNKLLNIYPEIILRNIDNILIWNIKLIKQDESKASFTCKRLFEDWRIVFGNNVDDIYNLIRWSTWPYFWAYCYNWKELIYIWEAEKIYKNYIWFIPWRITEFYNDWVWILCWDWNIIKIKKISIEKNKKDFVNPNKLLKSIKLTLK